MEAANMTISEAMSIGNKYMLEQKGMALEPTSAALMDRKTDKKPFWSLVYNAELLWPEVYDTGVDRTAIFLDVDNVTGYVVQYIPVKQIRRYF